MVTFADFLVILTLVGISLMFNVYVVMFDQFEMKLYSLQERMSKLGV